jgi:glutamine amidotransferase
MLTVIDSGIANIGSVLNACRQIGVAARVTRRSDEILSASALILPGVGAYADGMDSLRRCDLVQPIVDAVAAAIPILGICLGMQLLADSGEEFGSHRGLGLIPGRVRPLPAARGCRIPNMGWCPVQIVHPGSGMFANLRAEAAFYFAHSFHLVCDDSRHVTATTPWGESPIVAAVQLGPVQGVQFHPEKSQAAGLEVLFGFVSDRTKG